MKILSTIIIILLTYNKSALAEKIENEIVDLFSDTNEKISTITLSFTEKPSYSNIVVEDQKSFLQVRLPNTKTHNPGYFFESKSKLVEKIVTYQTNKFDTILRFYTNIKTSDLKNAIDAEVLNSNLIFSIDHSLIGEHQVISSETITTLSPTIGGQNLEKNSFNLNQKLQELGYLSLLLFLLFAISLFIRYKMRHKRNIGQKYENFEMKIINQLSLSYKQKMAVVQVGNQTILVSITPDNINLMTELSIPPKKEYKDTAQKTQKVKSPTQAKRILAPRKEQIPNKKQSKDVYINESKKNKASTVNISITDDGLVKQEKISNNSSTSPDKSKSELDLRSLIREKLSSLPKV